MNLYLISAPTKGYDVYSDAVVAAESEEDAKRIHPGNDEWTKSWPEPDPVWDYASTIWVKSPTDVTAELVGEAVEGMKRGVVCASFHAG